MPVFEEEKFEKGRDISHLDRPFPHLNTTIRMMATFQLNERTYYSLRGNVFKIVVVMGETNEWYGERWPDPFFESETMRAIGLRRVACKADKSPTRKLIYTGVVKEGTAYRLAALWGLNPRQV